MNKTSGIQLTCSVLFCLLLMPGLLPAQTESGTQEDQPNSSKAIAGFIKYLDRDDSGTISKDEAPERLQKNFDRLDSNSDGNLGADELKPIARFLNNNQRNNQSSDRSAKRPGKQIKIPEDVLFEENVAYRSGESKMWKLDLFRPKEDSDAPRPAIIFIHGGGWKGGDKGGGMWRSMPIEYAQEGYVCISVNYRLTQEAPFPACVEDCKCAVRWLRANAQKYNLDADRIGAYGNSAGAHLVSMLGLVDATAKLEGDGPYQEFSSAVTSVCCAAPPTDLLRWKSDEVSIDNWIRPGKLLAGDEETALERGKAASPISYAHKNAVPFLVVHGTADKTVPVKQGDSFVQALKDAGAPDVTYMRIDGAGHGVFNQHQKETYPAMKKFFARTLKGK